MAVEFRKQGVPYAIENNVEVLYEGECVGTQRLDFVIDGRMAVELKAASVTRQEPSRSDARLPEDDGLWARHPHQLPVSREGRTEDRSHRERIVAGNGLRPSAIDPFHLFDPENDGDISQIGLYASGRVLISSRAGR